MSIGIPIKYAERILTCELIGFVMSKNRSRIIKRMMKLNELATNMRPIKTSRDATVSIVVAANMRAYMFLSLKIAIIPNKIKNHDKAKIIYVIYVIFLYPQS